MGKKTGVSRMKLHGLSVIDDQGHGTVPWHPEVTESSGGHGHLRMVVTSEWL